MLRQREPPQSQSIGIRNITSTTSKGTRRRMKQHKEKHDTWNKYCCCIFGIKKMYKSCIFIFELIRSFVDRIVISRKFPPSFVVVIFIVFWINIYCYRDYYSYIISFPSMNHSNVNQTLLRFQQEYYKSNMKTNCSTFPRWRTTIEHSKHVSIDTGGSNVHKDVVDDSFNELMFTIYAVLQKNNSFDSSTVNHNKNNDRITSKLPYDTQPSFQNIYIITSAMNQVSTGSPSIDTLQLYKYTLPNTQTQMVQDRARYMESFLVQMLSFVQSSDNMKKSLSSKTKNSIDIDYSTFRTAIQKFGGIVYVVSYTDSQFCCDSTTTTTPTGPVEALSKSIFPIFTLSAPIHCQYAFPIPTYETIIYTQKLETSQRKRIIPIQFMDRYIKYPWWYRRYGQAVWRGSPTGSIRIDENVRWMLCRLSHQYPHWIDAKFVGKTQRWPILAHPNHSIYIGERISIRDMQKYRAIIDVDGNSWSSRFGTLLCQSSVVLKVQPRYVDYFYPTLRPWEHYIPIREDLSDLVEYVRFATSMNNTVLVQQIIYNANEWCRRHMTTSNLMHDMTSIFDTYISNIMLPSQHHQYHSNNSKSALLIPLLMQQYNFTRVVAG